MKIREVHGQLCLPSRWCRLLYSFERNCKRHTVKDTLLTIAICLEMQTHSISKSTKLTNKNKNDWFGNNAGDVQKIYDLRFLCSLT